MTNYQKRIQNLKDKKGNKRKKKDKEFKQLIQELKKRVFHV